MTQDIICPYRAAGNGSCSHKDCKFLKNKKRACDYKNPTNCELYVEWLRKRRKIDSRAVSGRYRPIPTEVST